MTVSSIFRVLRCGACRDEVEVMEIPVRHLDPERFVCGQCLSGSTQLAMGMKDSGVGVRRTEKRQYDPSQSALPI